MTIMKKKVLASCLDCLKESALGEICHRWVEPRFRERFGGTFHQSILKELAALGYLNEGDLVRGKHRRYYTIPDPKKCEVLLRDLQIPAVDWGTEGENARSEENKITA